MDRNSGCKSGRRAWVGRDILSLCFSRLETRVPIHLHFPEPPHLTVINLWVLIKWHANKSRHLVTAQYNTAQIYRQNAGWLICRRTLKPSLHSDVKVMVRYRTSLCLFLLNVSTIYYKKLPFNITWLISITFLHKILITKLKWEK